MTSDKHILYLKKKLSNKYYDPFKKMCITNF